MRRALCLVLLYSCKNYTFGLENRPCDGQGACLPGYACNAAGLCVPVDEASCAVTGTCQDDNPMTCTDADNNGVCDVPPPPPPPCTDADADSTCDDLDTCIDVDEDGLGNGANGNSGCVNVAADSNDGDAQHCADTDGDTCDDCSSGSFAPMSDGIDADGDGQCHAVQPDEDGDGIGWADGDVDDGNSALCRDEDGDQCDDCSQGLPPNQADDGPDFDGNGQCDVGDPDDDKDGVLDDDDDDDGNVFVCQDVDGDGCDDCALDGTSHPWHDGIDVDMDGLCANVTSPGADCDDTIPTCRCPTCTATNECNDDPGDSDYLPECLERFCTATVSNPNGVTDGTCRLVTYAGDLRDLADEADAQNIFIGQSFGVGAGTIVVTSSKIIHQRFGTVLTVEFGGDDVLFEMTGDDSELHNISMRPCVSCGDAHITDVVVITGDRNAVVGSRLSGMKDTGIFLNGVSAGDRVDDTYLAGNIITAMATLDGDDGNATGIGEGGIVLEYTDTTRILRNIINLNHPGIVLKNAIDTTIDHNSVRIYGTLTDDLGSNAVVFVDEASSGSCMRNNLLLNVQSPSIPPSAALLHYENHTYNTWSGTCTSADNVFSGLKQCERVGIDSSNDDCSALPAGFISSVALDPATDFTGIADPTLPGYACLDNPALIDNASFTTIDAEAVTNPEPGAREANTPLCPPLP